MPLHDFSPGSVFKTKIFEVQLAAAAASIDTGANAIPGEFRNLWLIWSIRGSAVAVSSAVVVRFNNDSGANYYAYRDQVSGTAPTSNAAESLAATSARFTIIPAANAPASEFGVGTGIIPVYSFTDRHKSFRCDDWHQEATTTGNQDISTNAGSWQSTAAINQITLLTGDGSNFASGSYFAGYAS